MAAWPYESTRPPRYRRRFLAGALAWAGLIAFCTGVWTLAAWGIYEWLR